MTDLRVDKSMMPRRSFGARLLSMVLVFSYIITFVVLGNAVLGLTAYADDNENSDFNIYVYMADYLLAQDKPSGKSFSFYMNEVKPMAEIWTESMTPEFEASVLAWETINLILDPADSASKALDAKGYYMTVIMSMLEASYSCDSTIKKLNNSMVKDASKIYKEFCSCFKEISNSELKDFLSKGSFTDDERALVNAAQKRYLENNKFLGANQIANDIIFALDASQKPEEYVKKFIEYCNLYKISDEWKQCLSDMNEKCDRSNKPLAAALETLVVVSSDLNNSIYQLWKDGINEAGAQFFKYGVKELLKVMLDNCPLIKGIDLGKAIGTTISNMLFATDKTIEEYYVISAYCDVFNLYKSTLRDVINEYRNDRTPENAQKFISYFDMFFTVYESGNNFGQDFTDVLFTEGIVSKIMRSEEQYKQITKNTEDMTRYAEQAKKNLSQNWITDLAEDHSDIYEALVSLVELDGQYISVTRVAFERESVEWGLNDVVFNGYECAAYPEEADCRDIVYSSSDENVALIDNNGMVHVNGIGSCEITAISVDNEDATDTLSVTVIEEGGADSVRVIDIVPIKPQVEYTYTENRDGTLTITGYTGRDTVLDIPAYINGKAVTAIGYNAFNGNQLLTSVNVPDSVTSINVKAFYYCINLEQFPYQIVLLLLEIVHSKDAAV